jgi:hypothetical protein
LVCGAESQTVTHALSGALLTDDELTRPESWTQYEDPFGDWHEDPCDELDESAPTASERGEGERR